VGRIWQNLTKALADASIKSFHRRPATSITRADVAVLEAAVSDWFADNAKPRTYLIPCWILADMPTLAHAQPFAVGPVKICYVSNFLKQEGIKDPHENIAYGKFFQAMHERDATWVAEVQIDDCDEMRGSDTA
jgi:hypothetical protein